MTFEEDDKYSASAQYRRSEPYDPNRDGLPFWVSIVFIDNGRLHYFQAVRFSTRQGAEEAARAMVEMNLVKTVFIYEDIVAYRPCKTVGEGK